MSGRVLLTLALWAGCVYKEIVYMFPIPESSSKASTNPVGEKRGSKGRTETGRAVALAGAWQPGSQ
jgi:hypothetical protein